MENVKAPADWGTLKSNKFYAEIDGKICPVRPSLEFIFYKGRWRPIEKDETGQLFVEGPGFIVSFELKTFAL